MTAGPRRAARTAASTAPGESFIPGLLAAFSRRHPDLSARLHVMDSQAVERCIEDRTCDVGFLGHRPAPGLLQVIGHDELVLAVPRGHPSFDLPEVEAFQLPRETFVERDPGSGSRRTVAERLMAAGIPYDQRCIALTASSAQALQSDRDQAARWQRRRLKKASRAAVGYASSTRREFPTGLRPAVTVIAAPCREAPAPSGVQPARSDWAFAANKHRTAPSLSPSTAFPST